MLKFIKSQPLIVRGLAIFVPLLLATSSLFFLIYRAQVAAAKDRLVNREVNKVEVQKKLATQRFQEVVADLMILTNQGDLQALGSGLLDPAEAGNALEADVLRQKLITDYLLFSSQKRLYGQVRFLDPQGQELIRIDFDPVQDSSAIIPNSELQNKGDRYYFEEAIPVGQGEIFMSPFDLNVEQGKVQEPYLPMIRFAAPAFDQQERRTGLVVLIFLGQNLLDRLELVIDGAAGQFMLLNSAGYWLKGPTPEEEWGFMFDDRQDQTYAQRYTEVWQEMQAASTGQLETAEGLFIFAALEPLEVIQQVTNRAVQGISQPDGSSYRWEIESFVSPEVQSALSRRIFAQLLPLYLLVVGVISVATLLILKQMQLATQTQNRIVAGMAIAEKISAGDLTTRLDLGERQDDLNRLLRAFDTMTERLSQLIGQIQASGIQVTSSTTQLASASHQLEATLSEQVASTHEINATTQQIAATSEELSHQVEQVADRVSATATTASQSQQELSQMEQTVRQLVIATDSISNRLGLISDRANTINSVISTITKVADQTNLLSLNAAIEAEKAGEYGAGFGVVAREIRRLADQTAVATLEIEDMVKDMQSTVASGVMEVDKFSQEVNLGLDSIEGITQQITQVIEQVTALDPQFTAINQSTEAQSEGAQQISAAMGQLNDTSQQTAQSMQENSRAIADLNQVVQGFQQEIACFKVSA